VLSRSELKANTPNTKTDPGELMAEFRKVRAEGYALIDQELELGLCSIAVPVENDRGQTVAAINIGAPAAHVPAAEMVARYLPLLKETQAALRTVLR
jgi:IclR family pca regulon transcriptional regulator